MVQCLHLRLNIASAGPGAVGTAFMDGIANASGSSGRRTEKANMRGLTKMIAVQGSALAVSGGVDDSQSRTSCASEEFPKPTKLNQLMQSHHQFMKKLLLFAAVAAASVAMDSKAFISVGPTGSGTITFNTAPA